MKHTQAPWEISQYSTGLYIHGAVADVPGTTICFMALDRSDEAPEQRANAILIEAAPEMLEALRLIATQCLCPTCTTDQAFVYMCNTAKAAIAKATKP